jgi:small subunit ribosomal protein S2
MVEMSVKEMLEAGVHFGHQTHRWDPRMKPFIYGARNGIHIIDLQKTAGLLRQACDFVTRVVADGGNVLFVGTKRQAQSIVQDEARKAGMFFVTHRWLGGTLTNFKTIRASIDRLKDLEKKRDEGGLQGLTKKEKLGVEREIIKLTQSFGGIKEMNQLPAVIFVIDPHNEAIAHLEAKRLKIPMVAVADTNCNPDGIDYLIPGNDDAIKSIRLFSSKIAQACLDGIVQREQVLREKVAQGGEKGGSLREAAGQKGKAYVSNPEAYEKSVEGGYTGKTADSEAPKDEDL